MIELKTKEIKENIINAGKIAIEQLISVAKEDIIKPRDEDEKDISADRLKNAAQAKKIAIFDAFEILERIEAEKESLKFMVSGGEDDSKSGFPERRVRVRKPIPNP